MANLEKTLKSLFDVYGIKTVSKNDKAKQAYCVNKAQKRVLEKAGKEPSLSGEKLYFEVEKIGGESGRIDTSYYYSMRGLEADRTPEPRMGKEFIREWLKVGDRLFLATDGTNIYACKLDVDSLSIDDVDNVIENTLKELSDEYITERAARSKGKPKKKKAERDEYVRNIYVIEAAKRRNNYKCEMPGCKYRPFLTGSGKPYIEVHHIIPLSEGGKDEMGNVAALCPKCHREQHYAKKKDIKRQILRKAIQKK